jgi:hypothetical protein
MVAVSLQRSRPPAQLIFRICPRNLGLTPTGEFEAPVELVLIGAQAVAARRSGSSSHDEAVA